MSTVGRPGAQKETLAKRAARVWNDTNDFAVGAIGAVTIAAVVFTILLTNPPIEHLSRVGAVVAVEPASDSSTVVTIPGRRLQVVGVWPGVVGTPVAIKTWTKGGGPISLPIVRASELCFASGDYCSPIQNLGE